MPRTRKKKGSRKKGGSRTKRGPLLTREQQEDVLAVGLVALAAFILLALTPVTVFGEASGELFPSGNLVGVVGDVVAGALRAGLGGAALLVPPVLLLAGVRVGRWGPEPWYMWSGRLSVLLSGLLVLLPVLLHTLSVEGAAGGWLGRTVGDPLTGLLGWLGTLLMVLATAVVLCVLTLGWNPLRALGLGMRHAGGRAVEGAKAARDGLEVWRQERAAAADRPGEQAPAEVADDLPFAPETGDEAGFGAEEVAGEVPDPVPPPIPQPAPRPRSVEELLPDPNDPARLADQELPPLELLDLQEPEAYGGMEKELDRLGSVLVEKLRTFNVESELGGRTTGPVVTQFEVVPAAGVKVNRIANLDADLALALRAPSVRIVAPIPGKGAVGVEIPNPEPRIVQLREILQAPPYQRARGSLPLALGKDLTGRPYVADLGKMPHLLIAGATGSGKSVCINTIITSLVYRHNPDTLRLLMIDPKMVELSAYADLPHLRHQVVTDPQDAAGVLKWAVLEMERRYQLLSVNGVRSLGEFNKRVDDDVVLRRVDADGPEGDEDRWIYDDGKLPYIVVVVDELADLMMQVQSEIERPLAQLAQKARAIGIHLIVATQRPSVNVITGLIKANFPTRIAFRVASKTDSRTILDQNGAESLLGNGDMLFLPPGASDTTRIQGAFVSTEETDRLISWYRAREAQRDEAEERAAAAESDILEEVRASEQVDASDIVEEVMEDWDELFRAAAEVCITQNQGSTSLLQRRLKIGYGRAARIVDQLHEAGILSPPDGSKPRDVLVGMDALDLIMSGGPE